MQKTSSLLVFSENSESKSTFIAFGVAADYTVQFSEKNSYAIRRLIEQKVDLIIVEILYPAMTEVNFVDQLYKSAKGIPIIVVSSLFYDTKEIVFGKRIAAFILKPLTYEKLIEETSRIFKERESAVNTGAGSSDAERGKSSDDKKLSVLFEISRELSSKTNFDQLLKRIIELACETLEAERATLFIVDHEKRELWSRIGTGLDKKKIRVPLNKGIAGDVAKSGVPEIIDDPYSHPLFNSEVDMQTGYKTRNILCVPMKIPTGEVIGVFQMLNKTDGSFTKNDEVFLTAMASSTGIALENGILHEKIRAQLEEVQQSYDDLYIAQKQIMKEARFTAVSEAIAMIKHELSGSQIIQKAQDLKNLYPFDTQIKKIANEMIDAQMKIENNLDSFFESMREKLNSHDEM